MSWFVLKLLGLRDLFGKLVKWAFAHPIAVWAIVATAVWAWVTFVVVPGLHDEVRELQKEKAALVDEANKAYNDQIALNARWQTEYDNIKKGLDNEAKIIRREAAGNARDYIAANRLRRDQVCRGASSPAASPEPAGDTEGAGGVSRMDGVLVSEESVRICTDNTIKALVGHKFAEEILAVEANGGGGGDGDTRPQ